MSKNNIQANLLAHLEEFFEQTMSTLDESVQIVFTEEQNNDIAFYKITISGEDLQLLIGYHAKGLNALQQWLYTVANRYLQSQDQADFQFSILLDIGNYRAEQDEKIKQRAIEAIEQVTLFQEPVEMPRMSPRHRRIVHMIVSENDNVSSESVGDIDRHVVINYTGK